MNEFDDCGKPDVHWRDVAEHSRGEQEKRRSYTFAAGAQQVFTDLGNRRDFGSCMSSQLVLNKHEFGRDELVDVLRCHMIPMQPANFTMFSHQTVCGNWLQSAPQVRRAPYHAVLRRTVPYPRRTPPPSVSPDPEPAAGIATRPQRDSGSRRAPAQFPPNPCHPA